MATALVWCVRNRSWIADLVSNLLDGEGSREWTAGPASSHNRYVSMLETGVGQTEPRSRILFCEVIAWIDAALAAFSEFHP